MSINHQKVARDVLTYLEEHPDQHDQDTFFNPRRAYQKDTPPEDINLCQTTMCVAGTAVFLTSGVQGLIDHVYDPYLDFDDTGAKLLGLDAEESQYLFYDTNNDSALQALQHLADGNRYLFEEMVEEADI